MTGEEWPLATADRRWFFRAAATAGQGLASSPAIAQSPERTAPMPMHGVLGAARVGPGRLKIAMLVHPGMVMRTSSAH